eukprot:TRINITY_DN20633_c1_g1_i1.p1 TRINITY_DN20633_c1_g1~~TRINITY_DN20633_c1_g1_i1.p1  ORF type:complete len:431 (-),score=57.53 TRINITY_DN20633_c1_g1_i1:163-1455(-)
MSKTIRLIATCLALTSVPSYASSSFTVKLIRHKEKELSEAQKNAIKASESQSSSTLSDLGGRFMQHKTAYYGKIKIGHPGQEVSVVFDTGSGNVIVPNRNCKDFACQMHKAYDPDLSRTGKLVNQQGQPIKDYDKDQIHVHFGGGKITGNFYEDEVCIGGRTLCTRMDFIASTSESLQPFSQFKFDGIMGLSLDKLAWNRNMSIMKSFVDHGVLKQPLFSVFMTDSDQEDSDITFGEIHENRQASDMFWAPVNEQIGYWQVKMDDIIFNGKKQGICPDCQIAVDTGQSHIAAPPSVLRELSRRLKVQRDCSNWNQLPTIGFAVAGKVLNLEREDYAANLNGECGLQMLAQDLPPPLPRMLIFGAPFLRRYYTVFDKGRKMIGFAVAQHKNTPSTKILSLVEAVSEEGKANKPGHIRGASFAQIRRLEPEK